jgi:hypothetical protein
MPLKVPCDVKSPQTTITTSNIIRWRGLIDWCLTSSEQFFSYIQDENI